MQNEFLDYRHYFRLIKNKILLILAVVVFFSGFMVLKSYNNHENNYERQLTIIVDTFSQKENSDESNKADDLSLYQMLVSTYSELSTSEIVLNDIIEKLNLDLETENLRKMITASPKSGTQILYLNVRTDNLDLTEKITEQLGITLKNTAKEISGEDLIQVIDTTAIKGKSLSEKLKKDIPVYVLLSLIVIINIIIILDLLKQKIRSEEFIKEELKLEVLGKIPLSKEETK